MAEQGGLRHCAAHTRACRWAATSALKLMDAAGASSTRRTLLLPMQARALRMPSAGGSGRQAELPPTGSAAVDTLTHASGQHRGYGRVVTRAAALAALAAAEAANGKHERAVEAAAQVCICSVWVCVCARVRVLA